MDAKTLVAECCERHTELKLVVNAVIERLESGEPQSEELVREFVCAGIAVMIRLHGHPQLTDTK
jgi:hypothetical protein